jgi:hypothetical protein
MAIDVIAEPELPGGVIQGHDGSELGDDGLAGPDWSRGVRPGGDEGRRRTGIVPTQGAMAIDPLIQLISDNYGSRRVASSENRTKRRPPGGGARPLSLSNPVLTVKLPDSSP